MKDTVCYDHDCAIHAYEDPACDHMVCTLVPVDRSEWLRGSMGKRKEHRTGDDVRLHCHLAHDLPIGFEPDEDVTWDMVHHLLHRLKGWGRR